MELLFLGATRTVTGSKYLVTVNKEKILIDCGLYQGYKELRARNWHKLPVEAKDLDAIILTHAHIDHSGYIPLIVKNGYTGKIYCTRATRDLCAILLPDCGYLEEEDARRANKYGYSKHKPALPLYTRQEAIQSLEQFITVDYETKFQVLDEVSVKLHPAGHILGSAFVHLEHNDKSIIFTGDMGRPHHPIMKPPAILSAADYLVLESTYGDRLHEHVNPLDQLADVINSTVAKQGSVIIPAFAVGRTQDVLYYLYELKRQKRIPNVPIFLDSPMAQDASDLLIKYSNEHHLSPEQCKKICNVAKYVTSPEESKSLATIKEPVIIISASGMATGGRILHHLKNYLIHEQNTILFTGYQAPGTRGDLLVRGASEIRIYGEVVPVHAKVQLMQNMSAHSDYQEMLAWLKHIKQRPRKIFLTHGDLESALSLEQKISADLGWSCLIPEYLEKVTLK